MSPTAILSARTESMEKDAPKGEPFGIPTNLGCLLLWFSTSGEPLPETVKNPTGFFGPLFVQCISCPISRGLPRSDNGGTAYSVRRWEQSEPDGPGPPGAILSARTESMEKDAPKGGPYGIPPNLECLLLWFSTSGEPLPETVKNPTGFFGPLIVRCTSCPISRRLPRSDNGGTAYSVRRREQSEPDGGGDAPPKERTTGRGSCPLWVYKGPCPLLALSPISVHTEMGPSETRPPLGSGKYSPRRASPLGSGKICPRAAPGKQRR